MSAIVAVVSVIFGFILFFQRSEAAEWARISNVVIQHAVPYGTYLNERNLPKEGVSEMQLRRLGVVVVLDYEVVGLRGKKLSLAWELRSSATETIVAEDRTLALLPSKERDLGESSIWIPVPRVQRDYYVTISIREPDGSRAPMDQFSTQKFRGYAGT